MIEIFSESLSLIQNFHHDAITLNNLNPFALTNILSLFLHHRVVTPLRKQ